jgi:hypothetical protein
VSYLIIRLNDVVCGYRQLKHDFDFNIECLLSDNTEERTSMAYVQKVVREINERIKPFDMAIRSASCELTGKKFYVFLISVEKPIMK